MAEREIIEFRYDTQLLLDKYVEDGADPDDVSDDLVDEIREHILETFQGDCLVLAGDRDLITERETRHIAGTIPGAELRILEGEGHETYIIHRTRIAELILEYAKKTESRR